MEVKICQSCGMPMTKAEQFGTNKDGSHNHEYCIYCYMGGEFTADLTMDEMIEQCAKYLDEFNHDSDHKFTYEEAITGMREYFPKLSRWKQA